MQVSEYQLLTPPRANFQKRATKCTIFALVLALTACQPRNTICGVSFYGTPFQLMQELTYNPNATTFPHDYLIAFDDTTFIYCIDHDGTPRTITCITDTNTHQIIKVF